MLIQFLPLGSTSAPWRSPSLFRDVLVVFAFSFSVDRHKMFVLEKGDRCEKMVIHAQTAKLLLEYLKYLGLNTASFQMKRGNRKDQSLETMNQWRKKWGGMKAATRCLSNTLDENFQPGMISFLQSLISYHVYHILTSDKNMTLLKRQHCQFFHLLSSLSLEQSYLL